ncbi:unnamed protein product, partial [Mesorhabditis spiculigera]
MLLIFVVLLGLCFVPSRQEEYETSTTGSYSEHHVYGHHMEYSVQMGPQTDGKARDDGSDESTNNLENDLKEKYPHFSTEMDELMREESEHLLHRVFQKFPIFDDAFFEANPLPSRECKTTLIPDIEVSREAVQTRSGRTKKGGSGKIKRSTSTASEKKSKKTKSQGAVDSGRSAAERGHKDAKMSKCPVGDSGNSGKEKKKKKSGGAGGGEPIDQDNDTQDSLISPINPSKDPGVSGGRIKKTMAMTVFEKVDAPMSPAVTHVERITPPSTSQRLAVIFFNVFRFPWVLIGV